MVLVETVMLLLEGIPVYNSGSLLSSRPAQTKKTPETASAQSPEDFKLINIIVLLTYSAVFQSFQRRRYLCNRL